MCRPSGNISPPSQLWMARLIATASSHAPAVGPVVVVAPVCMDYMVCAWLGSLCVAVCLWRLFSLHPPRMVTHPPTLGGSFVADMGGAGGSIFGCSNCGGSGASGIRCRPPSGVYPSLPIRPSPPHSPPPASMQDVPPKKTIGHARTSKLCAAAQSVASDIIVKD